MYDIITIGDSMRDIFLFPEPGEIEKPISENEIQSQAGFEEYLVFGLGDKVTVNDVYFSLGGTAANVAVGLAKLGLKSAIISAVGSDNAGEEIIKNLKAKKVITENIKIHKKRHSSFSVIISYQGERTIFVYHAFDPSDFSLPENLKANWLYLGPMASGYERIFNQIVSLVVSSEIKVAVNPGAVQIKNGLRSFGGLLRLIEIIFLNRQEAQELAGLKGVPKIRDLAKIICQAGPKKVVITDGKEGAYVFAENDFFKIGAYPEHRLDATGAGDAFAVGFLDAEIAGLPLREALKWGVTNSASVIAKVGAQEGLLGRTTLRKKVGAYRWPPETLRFS